MIFTSAYNMGDTRSIPLQSKHVIYLTALAGSSVQPIDASGLDAGITEYYSFIEKAVVLQ